MWKRTLAVLIASAALSACSSGSNTNSEQNPPAENPSAAGVVTGRVVDSQGNPLPGAKVVIGSTIYYNSNVIGVTGTDGRYRIQLPKMDVGSSWYAYGTIQRQYNGRTYSFDLHPESTQDFNGDTGAVRNFQWKLSGEKVGRIHGFYGGTIRVVTDADTFYDFGNVYLTLTPSGPLVDGGTGSTLERRASADHNVLDVPVGRYTITARYAPEGQTPERMKVRLNDTGENADSVTVDFEPQLGGCFNCVTIDVQPQNPAP